jgi:hypothetical protein
MSYAPEGATGVTKILLGRKRGGSLGPAQYRNIIYIIY